MKCLVTGAAGFIGSHLCERLIADGHEVFGVDDLSSGRRANLTNVLNHPKFHFIRANIINGDISLASDFSLPDSDWIFHLAGKADLVPSIENPDAYHATNVTGTLYMLQLAIMMNAKRFIYAASSSCYGIPDEYPTSEVSACRTEYPYALTKLMGEQYVMHWAKVYKLPAVSLRLFNVFGPRSRTSGAYGAVFGVFLAQLANNKPLTVVGDGTQKRDFTYVTDVVDAFVKAAEADITGQVINIGTGYPQSVNKLVELLGNPPVEYLPKRPGEPDMTFANPEKARKLLQWFPKKTFEQGVAIMKEHIGAYKAAPLWNKESIGRATKSWFENLGAR